MYSAPESRAARSKAVSTLGRPNTFSIPCTGGGPPSAESGEAKKRATENVEHGGEATTAT
eukprot:6183909-Pleurochrysis_carterae.AAC.3